MHNILSLFCTYTVNLLKNSLESARLHFPLIEKVTPSSSIPPHPLGLSTSTFCKNDPSVSEPVVALDCTRSFEL